jgi:hypothetical protein
MVSFELPLELRQLGVASWSLGIELSLELVQIGVVSWTWRVGLE